jgi:hypothetical protein
MLNVVIILILYQVTLKFSGHQTERSFLKYLKLNAELTAKQYACCFLKLIVFHYLVISYHLILSLSGNFVPTYNFSGRKKSQYR